MLMKVHDPLQYVTPVQPGIAEQALEQSVKLAGAEPSLELLEVVLLLAGK